MTALDHITTVADLLDACEAADAASDADAADIIAEAAWDAADELTPYQTEGGN